MISPEEAIALGMGRLAAPYAKNEEWMMQNVINDMKRGNITHAIVKGKVGKEVWRSGIRTCAEAEKQEVLLEKNKQRAGAGGLA